MDLLVLNYRSKHINPLTANPTKWSNTLKQYMGCCQQVF